ncbi:hypothetical protein SS37A_19480 [Methylocystis iwaonis]|uniref:Uncharacterized protein n=1 Tax=Methylocystis iwaonis TaxID=2885079 RepID=A0ABM8E8W0_9HYPH|nr:hypothetical protein SS37A_19480 [Methylocystis iwaonis]
MTIVPGSTPGAKATVSRAEAACGMAKPSAAAAPKNTALRDELRMGLTFDWPLDTEDSDALHFSFSYGLV